MFELVNINKGLEDYRNTEGALLVDVRGEKRVCQRTYSGSSQ